MVAPFAVTNADVRGGAIGPALSASPTALSAVAASIGEFAEATFVSQLAGSAVALSVIGEGKAASEAGGWKGGEASVVIGCRGLALACIPGVPARRCWFTEAPRRLGHLKGPGGPPRHRTGTAMVPRWSWLPDIWMHRHTPQICTSRQHGQCQRN